MQTIGAENDILDNVMTCKRNIADAATIDPPDPRRSILGGSCHKPSIGTEPRLVDAKCVSSEKD